MPSIKKVIFDHPIRMRYESNCKSVTECDIYIRQDQGWGTFSREREQHDLKCRDS